MLRVLVLSFYYQPDLSAGSFRMTAFVKALLDRLPEGSHVELITTLPNRYSTFSPDAPALEEYPGLTVHRIALSAHKSGVADQAVSFLGYARAVRRLTKGKDYDRIFATSSRLMTAVLGAYVAKRIRRPLYLDIRDIFVDTIKDVFSRRVNWAAKPVFSLLERWAVRSAYRVNLVSKGFLPYFQERYPEQFFSLFTNGIDAEFLQAQPNSVKLSDGPPFTVVYAGNFGEGQGLHAVIPDLAKRMEGRVNFVLIGDGGRKQQLKDAVEALGCTNVEIRAPVKRDQLIRVYQEADVLFLHLNDYDAFKKVLPSKLFEYGALGKPIWAGVAGYAADFIRENIDNGTVFAPCDVKGGEQAFAALNMQTQPREEFAAKYARERIMGEMAVDVTCQLD